MVETNRVVAKFIDGRIIKGHTNDFLKSRPHFHLRPADESGTIKIPVSLLKAIFFVKTFEGRKSHHRKLRHVPLKENYGKKAKVIFEDGESIEGCIQVYNPEESVFLLVPNDPTGNNVRIFCNRNAVEKIIWQGGGAQTVETMSKKKFDITKYI